MAYNVNYQDAGETISPHITTSAEYDNAISGFISVSADYENSIRRMELTITQKAMNLLVSDEDGTPQECAVKITSDEYADINETTDSDGWLSTDCPPAGVLEISCPGKITQTHDYDTDLLAGGVLQYTLLDSVPVIFTNKGMAINTAPSNPQSKLYHLTK